MQKLVSNSKKFALAIGLGGLGLILLVYGLTMFWGGNAPEENFSLTTTKQTKEGSATKLTASNPIVIDIAGAVQKPGVYSLPEDSRVKDAIQAAGGFRETADRELIARQFNLAMRLSDGMKLYIPPKTGQNSSPQGAPNADTANPDNHAVNINTASESELDALPGVGKVTAGKVIAGRPYTATSELVEKKIISQKVFDQIKDHITPF